MKKFEFDPTLLADHPTMPTKDVLELLEELLGLIHQNVSSMRERILIADGMRKFNNRKERQRKREERRAAK